MAPLRGIAGRHLFAGKFRGPLSPGAAALPVSENAQQTLQMRRMAFDKKGVLVRNVAARFGKGKDVRHLAQKNTCRIIPERA